MDCHSIRFVSGFSVAGDIFQNFDEFVHLQAFPMERNYVFSLNLLCGALWDGDNANGRHGALQALALPWGLIGASLAQCLIRLSRQKYIHDSVRDAGVPGKVNRLIPKFV